MSTLTPLISEIKTHLEEVLKLRNAKKKKEDDIQSNSSEGESSLTDTETDNPSSPLAVGLIAPETAREAKKREKVELEKLVKKNKRRVMKLVSCCLIPLAALAMLRRALEAML